MAGGSIDRSAVIRQDSTRSRLAEMSWMHIADFHLKGKYFAERSSMLKFMQRWKKAKVRLRSFSIVLELIRISSSQVKT